MKIFHLPREVYRGRESGVQKRKGRISHQSGGGGAGRGNCLRENNFCTSELLLLRAHSCLWWSGVRSRVRIPSIVVGEDISKDSSAHNQEEDEEENGGEFSPPWFISNLESASLLCIFRRENDYERVGGRAGRNNPTPIYPRSLSNISWERGRVNERTMMMLFRLCLCAPRPQLVVVVYYTI